jgi:hypothetical protein
MRLFPRGSVVVVTVATPFVTVEVPITVDPFANETVPVTFAERVSVKITEPPGKEGFIEDVKVDVGLNLATIWVVVPAAEL